jgi:hypothetical protein
MAYDLVEANPDFLYPEEKTLFKDLQKTFKKNRDDIIRNLKEQRVEIMRLIGQTKQSATIPPTGVVTALPPVTSGEFMVQCWNNICRTIGLKGGKKRYKKTQKRRNKKTRKHSNRKTRNKK